MLIEHRVDDVNEGDVAGKEAVPAGQEIALQSPLALVFAEHLHHPPIRRQMIIIRKAVRHPSPVGDFQDVLPAIGIVFVRTEEAEIPTPQVQLHRIP
jgi:hypothetical protein